MSFIFINSLISLNKSFTTWLQDKKSQFNSAVNVLITIKGGGIIAELRDICIVRANANISVIDKFLSHHEKETSFWEKFYNTLIANPGEFVKESMFNDLDSPKNLEEDFNLTKNYIHSELIEIQSCITDLSQWQ